MGIDIDALRNKRHMVIDVFPNTITEMIIYFVCGLIDAGVDPPTGKRILQQNPQIENKVRAGDMSQQARMLLGI